MKISECTALLNDVEGAFSDSHIKNGTQIGHFSRGFLAKMSKNSGLLGRKKIECDDPFEVFSIETHISVVSLYRCSSNFFMGPYNLRGWFLHQHTRPYTYSRP